MRAWREVYPGRRSKFWIIYASRIVFTPRLLVGGVGGMGTMGLLLAQVGLYGLVGYNASRRTREIGIRMAVGVEPGAVLRMVLRHGLQLAAGGILAGLVASVAANNALRAVFANSPVADFGAVPESELPIYAQTVFALVVVVLLAMYFPARRAARIDPLSALRQERFRISKLPPDAAQESRRRKMITSDTPIE